VNRTKRKNPVKKRQTTGKSSAGLSSVPQPDSSLLGDIIETVAEVAVDTASSVLNNAGAVAETCGEAAGTAVEVAAEIISSCVD
jgi:hypothetical protein